MPREQKMDDPTATPGQIRTGQLFADIVDQFGESFIQMHGSDRGPVSSELLLDAGPIIKRAIIAGRQTDGWLSRVGELDAARKALSRRFGKLTPIQVNDVTGEMGKFLAEVGEGILENRPY